MGFELISSLTPNLIHIFSDESTSSASQTSQSDHQKKSYSEKQTTKVLLIEDNDGDYGLVRELIHDINDDIAVGHFFELTRAESLNAAIDRFKDRWFDVVLLDLSLPDTKSSETVIKFRNAVPGASVIVFSELSDLEIAIRSVCQGAEDYIVKDRVDPNLLYRSILYAHERNRRLKEKSAHDAQIAHTERLKSLGVLSGGIAHDFNNVLTAILANIELAKSGLAKDSSAFHPLDRAVKAINLASGLTRQLLNYAGNKPNIVEELNFTIVIDNMKALLASVVSPRAKLNYSLESDLPCAKTASPQITQIVMNLVINASDALGTQNGSITVSTGLRDLEKEPLHLSENFEFDSNEGKYVYIQVADSGCGISPEDQKKLFDPFFSTKGSGRGLGLTAVYGIVREHGGYIELSSSGEGTQFTILFPAIEVHKDEVAAEPVKQNDTDRRGCILIVEDNELVGDVTQELLSMYGYQAILAKSGTEALNIFEREQKTINLILLDLTMPDMDGLEVFDVIRKSRKDTPVVFVSGFDSSYYEVSKISDSLTTFLQKPYPIETLIPKIDQFLKPI